MNPIRLGAHRLRNAIQSLLLIAGMGLVLTLSARWILGIENPFWVMAMVLAVLVLAPQISPRLILRMYRARELTPELAPGLFRTVAWLAERAGLEAMPRIYWLPTSLPNAMAMGRHDAPIIAVTDGLLRLLAPEELAGVLAHEVSHIRHRDTWIMGLADVMARMTWAMSWTGQMLLLLNLPLILLGYPVISWAGVLMLLFAPHISALLQLAMSRTREYDADMGAAALTGHPEWLMSALARLERVGRGWERLMMPDSAGLDPSLLRTHPPTEERIRRLAELRPEPMDARMPEPDRTWILELPPLPAASRPRRRFGGLWY